MIRLSNRSRAWHPSRVVTGGSRTGKDGNDTSFCLPTTAHDAWLIFAIMLDNRDFFGLWPRLSWSLIGDQEAKSRITPGMEAAIRELSRKTERRYHAYAHA